MSKLWPLKFLKAYMLEAMLETTYVLQAILPYNIYENLQTSEVCISKTFDLNDMKFGRAVKNAIVCNISKVWTCSS